MAEEREGYLCMSKRELDSEDLRYLAQKISCDVTFFGKVKGMRRWDYFLYTHNPLSEKDFVFIKQKGLVVLLSPRQRKSLANTLNLSKVAESVFM